MTLLSQFNELRDIFGIRFLLYLVITYFGMKGVTWALIEAAMLPYFQQMQVSGTMFQLATMVARIPWAMKGWLGVLSDVLPIGRYHKRGYLVLSAVVGVFGLVTLSVLPVQQSNASAVWIAAGLFSTAFGMLSAFDLLCEGKYSELMREEGSGSGILTYVWVCVSMGALTGSLMVGLFVDTSGPRPILAACIPLAMLAAWRSAAGDLPEMPRRSYASLRLKLLSAPGLFVLATSVAAGSLALAASAVLLDTFGQAMVAFTVSGILICYSFSALPKTLARCNLYMFIASVAYLALDGPIDYFYTASVGCISDAPHFSYSYYLAVSSVVASLGSAFGAVLFQYMISWQFRTSFCVTTLIQVLATFFDVVIIKRWNIVIGISDSAAYLFGDAACQSMAAQMMLMPTALLTARLCPRGAEATVFAILAGFQNFGMAVSAVFGVQLADAFGVYASKDGPCNFDNLAVLTVVGHCVVPVACLPLVWVLIPQAAMDNEKAFQVLSPAPSFMSPASSRGSSPASSPFASSPSKYTDLKDVISEYSLMDADGRQLS